MLVVLKWSLRKQDVKMWTEFSLLIVNNNTTFLNLQTHNHLIKLLLWNMKCISSVKYPQLAPALIECKSVHIVLAYFYDIHLTSISEISVENLLRKYYIITCSDGFINNPSSDLLLWIMAIEEQYKLIISLNKQTLIFTSKRSMLQYRLWHRYHHCRLFPYFF
jgi:hypothetical protein